MFHIVVLIPGESVAQLKFETRAAAETIGNYLLAQGYKSILIVDNEAEIEKIGEQVLKK